MSENTKPSEQEAQKDHEELKDDQLESVAGGIIDGGCVPPIWPPTLPTNPWEVPE